MLPQLPTRVIDVGYNDIDGYPKLSISDGMRGLYTALSHCWGEYQPVTTIKSTLPQRLYQISIDSLPRTFCDAIEVTRLLGIRYLWIDSLCILQDDKHDWKVESAKMADVYRNAYVTLSAIAAANCLGGLNHTLSPGHYVKRRDGRVACRRIADHGKRVRFFHSPLSRRAWALQKTLLSQRVIHFSNNQWSWQCTRGILYESGGSQLYPIDPRLDSLTVFMHSNGHKTYSTAQIIHFWNMVLAVYSERDLTKQTDKIAALAGLSRFFEKLLDEPSFLGVWKRDMSQLLLWIMISARQTATQESLGLPSWSPLSARGAIDSLVSVLWSPRSQQVVRSAQFLDGEVTWAGPPLTSEIVSTRLLLISRIVPVSAIILRPHRQQIEQLKYHCNFTICPRTEEFIGSAWFDSPVDEQSLLMLQDNVKAFEMQRRCDERKKCSQSFVYFFNQ